MSIILSFKDLVCYNYDHCLLYPPSVFIKTLPNTLKSYFDSFINSEDVMGLFEEYKCDSSCINQIDSIYKKTLEDVAKLYSTRFEKWRIFNGQSKKYYTEWLPILNEVISIANSINNKSYTTSVISLISIADEVFKSSDDEEVKWLKSLSRYGPFLAAVSNAQSEQDVEKILENFASPVRSYRLKRYSKFSIEINSYLGLRLSNERMIGDSKKPKFNSVAFSTPIGITFSTHGEKDWSYSLFISAIDLGALTSVRFADDEIEETPPDDTSEEMPEENGTPESGDISTLPELNFQNVFAPGAYFVVGVVDMPVSFFIGAQYGPTIRNIEFGSSPTSNESFWSLGFGVAVDIPIFRLFSN